jgi:hypothetical protein
MGRKNGTVVITIRPTAIPTIPGYGSILKAWAVNESHIVYLEKGYFFSVIHIEIGIGGRLIEPTFEDGDDFLRRTNILWGNVGIVESSDPTDDLRKAWENRGL